MSASPPRYPIAALALWLCVTSAGCGSSSAAAPGAAFQVNLTGGWAGTLPLRLPGDWSLTRVSLVQTGDRLSGEMVSRDAVTYPLSGTRSPDETTLSVGGLPGTSTCAGILLIVTEVEVAARQAQALTGRAAGRCFGTVAGEFRLERVTAAP